MNVFFTLVVVAILAEAVWEILKNLIPSTSDKVWSYINLVGSLLVGVLVAFVADVNIFALLGIDLKWPVVGVVLTGILISRGSNYIHDLVGKLKPDNVVEYAEPERQAIGFTVPEETAEEGDAIED